MARIKKQRPVTAQWWIGYCRKSTDSEDKQVNSLQDQATMIADYYARLSEVERQHPLRLLQEAQSAYHPGRPVYGDIMRMADKGEVRGLIVVHPNRVSRNHADSGAFVQRLVEGTIASLDTTTGKRYTGADSNDIFMLTLEGAMSWKDSRDKGDRIRQAMRLRAAEGKHMGLVRIGYQSVYRPDGTVSLEVVPEIAAQIRHIFELAGTGTYSLRMLVTEADQLGLRSRKGQRFWASNLHAILRDPLYKGFIRFDGIIAKGRHEPIVDETLWDRVQESLTSRWRSAGKPKNQALRELFIFGNLIKCPTCTRTLCPYRVKGKYVYYECKNPRRRCRVLVAQNILVEQLPPLIENVTLEAESRKKLRAQLLQQYQNQTWGDAESSTRLTDDYKKVLREIGELFSRRTEAEALGILDSVDMRLDELRRKRDELQAGLIPCPDEDIGWVDKTVESFRFIELLREAMIFGSMRSRELALRALASNFTAEDKKLVPMLRSPFRQYAKRHIDQEWYTGLYAVRTEIVQTFDLLQTAYAMLQQVG